LIANSLGDPEKNCILCFHDSEYADILLILFSKINGYQKNRNIFLTDDFISDYINTTIMELQQIQCRLSAAHSELQQTQCRLSATHSELQQT
jgi:hypothetical protein